MIEEYIQSILIMGILGAGVLWIARSLRYFTLPPPSRQAGGPQLAFKAVLQVFGIYFAVSLIAAPLVSRLIQQFKGGAPLVISPSSVLLLGWIQLFILSLLLLSLFLFCRSQDRTLMKRIWKDGSLHSPFFDLGLGVLSWIVIFPLVSALSELSDLFLFYFFGIENYEQVAVRYLKMTLASPASLSIAIFTILVAAPLMEELLFRGFLQTWLKQKIGRKAAIPLAALCFALFHFSSSQGLGNITLVLALFSLGCFLGFLYERQASLLAPIGLHMTFNAISTLRIIFNP